MTGKNSKKGTSRLYIYLGIIAVIFILFYFVFSNTNNDRRPVLVENTETTVVQAQQETTPEPVTSEPKPELPSQEPKVPEIPVPDDGLPPANPNTPDGSQAQPTTPAANNANQAGNTANQAGNKATPPQNTSTATANKTTAVTKPAPMASAAKAYANVASKEVVIQKGQLMTQVFAQENLNRSDLYKMLSASKAIEKVGENDKIIYQVKDGRVVSLHLVKRNGTSQWTYVLVNDKYEFVQH